VLVGSYTSIFIAAPILIYLGVGEGRETAKDTEPAEETPAQPAPVRR
jgi:preprotein translocase subunit SecF